MYDPETNPPNLVISHQVSQYPLSGWWFGTWLLFFHILGMSSSQLRNHQPVWMYYTNIH